MLFKVYKLEWTLSIHTLETLSLQTKKNQL